MQAGLGKGEYQIAVQLTEKLKILSFLCDHVVQTEESRNELDLRLMIALPPSYESPLPRIGGEGNRNGRQQEVHALNTIHEIPLQRKGSDKLQKSSEKVGLSREMLLALQAGTVDEDGNSNECMVSCYAVMHVLLPSTLAVLVLPKLPCHQGIGFVQNAVCNL